MSLSGPQYQQLQNALLSAFTDEDSLQQFVQIHLGESLTAIIGTGALGHVVFKLIGWAQAYGRFDDLLTGALTARPRSNEIRNFIATHFPALLPSTPVTSPVSIVLSADDRIKYDALTAEKRTEYEILQKQIYSLVSGYVELSNSPHEAGRGAQLLLLDNAISVISAKQIMLLDSNDVSNPSKVVRDQVFISYSHTDKRWLHQLLEQLAPLEHQNKVKVWSDTDLTPGAEWAKEIATGLATAKVAVLLVTPSFLASHFIAERELPPLLEAAEKEGVTIFWIAVRASNYGETPIAKYQAANDPARPLKTLSAARRDQEWVNISRKLLAAFNAH